MSLRILGNKEFSCLVFVIDVVLSGMSTRASAQISEIIINGVQVRSVLFAGFAQHTLTRDRAVAYDGPDCLFK